MTESQGGSPQVPEPQNGWSPRQACPHMPQFLMSLALFTQRPPQQVKPDSHSGEQGSGPVEVLVVVPVEAPPAPPAPVLLLVPPAPLLLVLPVLPAPPVLPQARRSEARESAKKRFISGG